MNYKEKVIALLNSQELSKEQKEKLENIFPELKESEDEKIRKTLIEMFSEIGKKDWRDIPTEKIIAWLEKQGDTFTKKDIDDAYLQGICDAKHELEEQSESQVSYDIPEGFYAEIKDDRVVIKKAEQKFKVGDWVIKQDGENFWNGDYAAQITNITDRGEHWFDNGSWLEAKDIRLWTINDAWDGDVLMTTKTRNCPFIYRKTDYNNDLAYYYAGVDGNGDFCEGCLKKDVDSFWPVENVSPATKEQRDLLFQKMKQAGYEWDAEKKELTKIDAYQLSENPCSNCANTKGCITCVNGDRKSTSTPRILYSDEVIEWLKPYGCVVDNIVEQFKKDFGL